MKTLNIYMAAQAVMYLPVYVAQEKGIFSTLLSEYNTKVNLISAGGDIDAIKRMNKENLSNDKNTFAIAIADPNAIKGVEEARVIGALIDRLSFWAVSKKDIDCNMVGIRKSDYKKVIHYDENLITGYNIGRCVRNNAEINDFKTIKTLGAEFDNFEEDSIIITPDLLTVALMCVNNEAYINYHFAKADRYMPSTYITTAIMTSKWCIENNLDISITLVRVIEAIQKAKSIIYSSKQIAREILMNMECINDSDIAKEKKEAVADFIIQIINDDRIYPSDLNISEKQWTSTNLNSDLNFSQFVYNDIVLQAERSIAAQFGITINETFADNLLDIERKYKNTIDNLTSEISGLKEQISKFNNSYLIRFVDWCVNNWFSILTLLCVIYTIIWVISRFFMCSEWTKDPVADFVAMAVAIPILINVFTDFKNRITR